MATRQTIDKIESKQHSNFIIQGSILAIAGIIVRIIGLAYRIPLTRIIGDEGNGYYAAAFNVYTVILLLSSYSLPLAVSKMISARIAKQGYINANKIFKAAMIYATVVGALGCTITWFGADYLANTLFRMPMSAYALKSLAPTIWIMGYLGVLRGYFQGHSTMIPTAVSQILEQTANAVVSVIAAWAMCQYALKHSASTTIVKAYGAAGGTIGTGAGALIGLIVVTVLFIYSRKTRKNNILNDKTQNIETYSEITKILFMTVVPVILSTAIYNISGIIDNSIYGISMDNAGLMNAATTADYGIYTAKYKLLVNIPVAIANSMASSLIPTLSKASAAKDRGQIAFGISTATRFATIVSIPSAIGLAVLANPIISLLFGYSQKANFMMVIGSCAIIFYSLSTISNAILQGINHMKAPVKHSAISLIIHVSVLVLLLNFVGIGVYSLVISDIVFSLSMCILNALAIRKYLNYRQEIIKTFIGPALCAIFMGVITYFSYRILAIFTPSNIVLTFIPSIISIIVYMFLLIKTKCINESELRAFPKGKNLVQVAKIIHLI